MSDLALDFFYPQTRGERKRICARGLFQRLRFHLSEGFGIISAVRALALAYVFDATPACDAHVRVRVHQPEPAALGLSTPNRQLGHRSAPPAPSPSAERAFVDFYSDPRPCSDEKIGTLERRSLAAGGSLWKSGALTRLHARKEFTDGRLTSVGVGVRKLLANRYLVDPTIETLRSIRKAFSVDPIR